MARNPADPSNDSGREASAMGSETGEHASGPDDSTEDDAELLDEGNQTASEGVTPEEAVLGDTATPRAPSGPTRGELRATYGYVRTYFKARPGKYQTIQRRLKQARSTDTYDEYLTDGAHRSIRTWVVTAILVSILSVFIVVTASFADIDIFEMLEAVPYMDSVATALEYDLVTDTIGSDVAAAAVVVSVVVVPSLASLAAVGVWIDWKHYRLRRTVARRRRNIALTLPYAITFLYALSRGGADILTSIRSLAAEDRMYGESAAEFDVLVREMDIFGNNLLTALRNKRDVTPSVQLEQFLTDLISVIDTGGNVESFLENEVDEYIQAAIDEQEQYLERLAALSEAFIVVFVAGPLFLIVVLVVISFLGGNTVPLLVMLIYVLLPAGLLGFVMLIEFLSRPFAQPAIPPAELLSEPPSATITDDPRYRAHTRRRRLRVVRQRVASAADSIQRRPGLAFWLTQPLALVVVVGAVLAGVIEPTLSAFTEQPVTTTAGFVVVPLLITTVPVAVLYERQARRKRELVQRFPDMLRLLANANQMGIPLSDALGVVADSMSGTLADELRTVRKDLRWHNDMSAALERFGARLSVPQLSRTLTIITAGSRVSGDLSETLEIAAENTNIHARLERIREQEMLEYVVIVVMGFLVYLFVIVMLSTNFIEPLTDVTSAETPDGPVNPVAPIEIPVDIYRTLFFHSALIQGFGCGVLAGKLAEDDLLAGLKYGLGLVVLALGVFVMVL